MTDQQEFCLRWNDFHSNFHLSLEALRGDETFTDVTLSCSGRLMRAHRVILSACSVHFKEILRGIPPQQHPVIVLPTVDYDVMQAILEFIYQGQVNVKQSQLGAFLQVAETFSIQGLADDETKKNANKTASRPRPADSDASPPPKRRREGLVRPDSGLVRPASPSPAAAPPPVPAGPAEPQAEGAESAGTEADKTVNISVSIKTEGMAESMVGELLEHSGQPGQMGLDPDMEPPGADVVAQAMATMSHESGDTSANPLSDSLRSLDSLVTALASPTRPASALRPVRSAVRDFFSGSGQDRVCRLCGVGVRLNRQLSTSGLWSHMRHRHSEAVRAMGVRPPPSFWPAAAAAAEGAAPAWPSSPLDGRLAPPLDGRPAPPLDGRPVPPLDGRPAPPLDGRPAPPRPPAPDCKAWFTQGQMAGRTERSPLRTESGEASAPDSV